MVIGIIMVFGHSENFVFKREILLGQTQDGRLDLFIIYSCSQQTFIKCLFCVNGVQKGTG